MHHFTPNDLVLYISGEMPLIKSKALEQQLLIDSNFFQTYLDLKLSWINTSNVELQPSPDFTNRLMNRLSNTQLADA